ncbi:MAG: hypothetical protein EP298_02670 [Gammaproteobacteria bacterium]|nr:MAG: hypothetical protein EP298_02670 [Gammaproteobacteria bacterium]UTW43410.1 hypothetical protein KFE69_04765 [bacterium SCSIO 12844]
MIHLNHKRKLFLSTLISMPLISASTINISYAKANTTFNNSITSTAAADPQIPAISDTVLNFSVNVLLPKTWTISSTVTYTLQGQKSDGSWSNVFGDGSQSNTSVTLSTTNPTRISVVVPQFSTSNFKHYRLLFMTPTYQMAGTIPLNFTVSGSNYSNNGSLPGNTYKLHWSDSGPVPADLVGSPSNAINKPTHPPKIQINPQTKQKQIYVWNDRTQSYQAFFIRGMDYEPTPVGQPFTDGSINANTAQGETVYLANFNKTGGGQICQPLPSGPFGSPNQSYCFDTDMTGFMHQYLNNTALKGADKPNQLLIQMWNRDLSLMQAMGVNTIRIYHIDPLVRNMTTFLNLAHSYGIYVIMPAPEPNSSQTYNNSPLTGKLLNWSQMTSTKNGQPWSALMQLSLAKYAGNPDILAWAVGNETFADTNADAAKVVRLLARTIKQYDPNILVTITNQDHYASVSDWQKYWNVFAKSDGSGSYIDFYSVNTYRGMGPKPQDFNLSALDTFFNTYNSMPEKIKLPLFISEWGKYDTYDWGSFANLWGYDLFWRKILLTAQKMNILGAAYFEFSDEPVVKNLTNQHYMGVVSYKLGDGYSTNPMTADTVVLKTSQYEGVKSGNDGIDQQYPKINVGIFDSFIGDNTHKACYLDGTCWLNVMDPAFDQSNPIPNISYCAYSESPSPEAMNDRCMKLDVKAQSVSAYKINITHPQGETIKLVSLNGSILKANADGSYTATSTGALTITLDNANALIGYSTLDGINTNPPSGSNNTLLSTNFNGGIVTSYDQSAGEVNIALPPTS